MKTEEEIRNVIKNYELAQAIYETENKESSKHISSLISVLKWVLEE